MREQWIKGLQWGAVAWLGYILAHTLPVALKYGHPDELVMAGAWLLSASLLLAGSRWARLTLGAALLAQAVTGAASAIQFANEPDVHFVLRYFLPMSLPLLPLLWLGAERPRYTIALALVGRGRDAARTLAGCRWLLVAAGLVSLNRAGWDLLEGFERGFTVPVLPIVLFGLAALPRLRFAATA